MTKPLFSICIPTFNRCVYLQNTLKAIVSQPEFLDGRVEVIISDNASDDNTPAVCSEYAKKYPNFHYYRNTRNVIDENFPLALSRGNGILRRLSNDTYIHDNGTLAAFCNLVEKYKESKPLIFFTDAYKKNVKNGVLPFHEFVVQVSYMVTWVGGFSVWEDECDGIEKDTDACQLRLWHVRKAFDLGYKKDACVVFNNRMGYTQQIKNRDMSYGLYQVFYKNFLSLLKPYIDNGSLTLKEYEFLRRDLLYNFLTTRIIDWELQREKIKYTEKENLKKLVFDEYKDDSYWNVYQLFYTKRVIKRKVKMFLRKLVGRE